MNIFYFTKSLLVLSLCIASPLYAMEPSTLKALDIVRTALFLHGKFQKEDLEKLEDCLQKGATPNFVVGVAHRPVISLAIEHQEKDVFKLLIEHKADINIKDCSGTTPLFKWMNLFGLSSTKNDIEIKDLLKNGASPHIKNSHGFTPLHWAVVSGFKSIIEPLIEYGADPENLETNDVCTALAQSIIFDRFEITKKLCDAGVTVTRIDNNGNTAFHLLIDKHTRYTHAVITHARFNADEQVKKIMLALLVFNRMNNPLKSEILEENFVKFPPIHHDIQLHILSKLLSPDCFHKGLYKHLLNNEKNYQLPLKLVHNHVQCFIDILQIKNNNNETAFELIQKGEWRFHEYTESELLFNGSKLQTDLETFIQNIPIHHQFQQII